MSRTKLRNVIYIFSDRNSTTNIDARGMRKPGSNEGRLPADFVGVCSYDSQANVPAYSM